MMDFLQRDAAGFSEEFWQQIDEKVTAAAKEALVARRFLPLHGPMGAGIGITQVDPPGKAEVCKDGFSLVDNRVIAQMPQLYEDFWLYWRDLEMNKRSGLPVDLTNAVAAAQAIAYREDTMVFYGVKQFGIDGILTAKGVNTQKRSDWVAGEGAFTDVVAATNTLLEKGRLGKHTLVMSRDLYVQLQRIQSGTGVLESDRIAKLVEGRLYTSTMLQPKTAFVLSAQPEYIDIAIGQDIRTGYTESVDLNHHLRVLETAFLRIKTPDAIVVLK